jgi:hypothetical protein|nr:MAG TPA: hypothetical protein [Caudoviricetes sp.]
MRQSKNYKWDLPEDGDEINVEDLNTVFTAVDGKLKTHDEELEPVTLSGSFEIISAEGSGTFYHGTLSGFNSLLQSVKTTYGDAEFGAYHGSISGAPGTQIQLYITLYIDSSGVLRWDEHYGIYDTIDVSGNILTSADLGIVTVGEYEAGGVTPWSISYINEDAESESTEEKEYSLREAINELALRIQALRSQQGGET